MSELGSGTFNVTALEGALQSLPIKKRIVLSDPVLNSWPQYGSMHNTVEIPYTTSDAYSTGWISNAASTGWSGESSIIMSSHTVTILPVKKELGIFKKLLEAKHAFIGMNLNSPDSIDPYETLIEDTFLTDVKKLYVVDNFQGTNSSTSTNGLLNQFTASTGTRIETTTSYTASTSLATIDDLVDEFADKISEDMSSQDLVLYMSKSNFDLYVRKLKNIGNRYMNPDAKANTIKYEGGTNFTIQGTQGLTGTDKMFLANPNNLGVAFRTPSIKSPVEMDYDFNSQEIRIRVAMDFVPVHGDITQIICNF